MSSECQDECSGECSAGVPWNGLYPGPCYSFSATGMKGGVPLAGLLPDLADRKEAAEKRLQELGDAKCAKKGGEKCKCKIKNVVIPKDAEEWLDVILFGFQMCVYRGAFVSLGASCQKGK